MRSEIEANSVLLQGLSEMERMQRNVKCPFLAAGRCTIYEARPQTCRNYHATDATGCRASYEQPENTEIDPDFAPLVYQTGGAHVDAFCSTLQQHGYDITAYELSTALAAAIADPESRARFAAKQLPFPTLTGTEVSPEFFERSMRQNLDANLQRSRRDLTQHLSPLSHVFIRRRTVNCITRVV